MSKVKTGQQGRKLGVGSTAGTQQKTGATNIASELQGKGIHSGRSLPKSEAVTTEVNLNPGVRKRCIAKQGGYGDGNPKKKQQ
jgi:hypothetical protein